GTHTSVYIDDSRWRASISNAGNEVMDVIGSGEWNESRWLDLIRGSSEFAEKSGLLMDSTRLQLFEDVKGVISAIGMDGVIVPMLCMLGKSVVVVPFNANSKGDFMPELADALEGNGFKIKICRVGSLA
ncbi:MAG TPA: hypothetical protein QF703_03075, partial [Candidatus Thalassarchaeaceae archaeon]|nr:hypothetical protein [Candidatus Thalassarchaeaceae archaeon]